MKSYLKILKNRLINLIDKFLSLSYFRTSKSKYGIYFVRNPLDLTYQFYKNAAYGFFYFNYLSNIKNEFIFLDIGANQGLYTICAAKNTKCLSVHAFEPVRDIFKFTVENVEVNSVAKKCNLWNLGLGVRSLEMTKINFSKEHSGSTSLINKKDNSDKDLLSEERAIALINNVFIDSLFIDNSFDIHVKIDVEGLEEMVINQLALMKSFSRVKSIFYEVDERWSNNSKISKLLDELGFIKYEKIYGKDPYHYDILASR